MIRKIQVERGKVDSESFAELMKQALVACFQPFGSLTWGVNGVALAEAILAYVGADGRFARLELASAVMKALAATTAGDTSAAEFGAWELALFTPSSRTEIRVRNSAGGPWIEVDFGPEGSETRSEAILAELRKVGAGDRLHIIPVENTEGQLTHV